MAKQLFIKTFGCQMNELDSEKIAGVLSGLGYSLTDSQDTADMIILNTCSVREKAESKCFSDLGRLNELKKEKPGLVIGVGGCVAQQAGKRIVERAPYVDMVFGTDNISDIPVLLEKRKARPKNRISTGRRKKRVLLQDKDEYRLPVQRNHPFKAYVNIVDGCDKFCTFCVVPFTRGRERSRPPADILNEIKGLALSGYKEVTLLGQNVDSYGKDMRGDTTDLAGLLERIHEIEGMERIRFVTSHPADFNDKLIVAMRDLSKVCNHLHLPIQSGSDSILERMKRNYTYQEYREKIIRLREAIPDVTVTTDIITGFPGESDEDFNKTMKALEEIQFDAAFTFRYSKRPFTFAGGYDNQVPLQVKKERLNKVIELQNSITFDLNKVCVGKEFDIMIEGESVKGNLSLTGRTRGNKIVHVPKQEGITVGDIIQVRITTATVSSLTGVVKEQAGGG